MAEITNTIEPNTHINAPAAIWLFANDTEHD
jgi:hypothetical protein